MPIWETKDGRILRLKDMQTSHIVNAVQMLRRQGWCSFAEFDFAWATLASVTGDMASYYAEQACANLRPTRMIDAMEEELEQRRRGK